MALLRQRATMISRDVCDHGALGFREARKFRIGDQVERMLLVRIMRNVITDVVQQGAGKHERTVVAREILTSGQTVKNFFRELCDLSRVSFFVTKAPSDSMYSAQFLIGEVSDGRSRLIFPFTQTIDDYTFSECPLAGPYHIDSQSSHRRFQDVAAGHDDLRSLRT